MKQVATLAGVSPMTVSRTLSGTGRVSEEIEARVREAAATLGYQRNENARSLRQGRGSRLIGVAITNLANPYYGNFAEGVEEAAWEAGLRILLGNTGEDPERERQLVADFVGRQVEGLIVVPTVQEGSHLDTFALHGLPLVLASRSIRGLGADRVLVDDVGGSLEGTRQLLDTGHRRIAFLGMATSVETGRRRFEGFSTAFAHRGLVPPVDLIRVGQQDIGAARQAMIELLDLESPPSAVFAANNRNAIGALLGIGDYLRSKREGRMPSVMSFDNFELASLMPVPVTIIDHDPQELGKVATRLLIQRMDGSAPQEFVNVQIPTTIHEATTLSSL